MKNSGLFVVLAMFAIVSIVLGCDATLMGTLRVAAFCAGFVFSVASVLALIFGRRAFLDGRDPYGRTGDYYWS